MQNTVNLFTDWLTAIKETLDSSGMNDHSASGQGLKNSVRKFA